MIELKPGDIVYAGAYEVSEQLKPGDIILCSSKWSLISWLIRSTEHCKWSHVAWVYNGYGAIEALSGGVAFTPLEDFDLSDESRYKVVRLKPGFVTDQQLVESLKTAMGYVGRPYDWMSIFFLAWYWAMKWRHSAPIPNNRRALICSEVIAMPLWQHAKFLFRDEIPAPNTAPKDIAVSDKVEVVGRQ